jgi:predicted ATPase
MVAANPNYRFSFTGSNRVPPVNRLAERVRHYFDQHPEVSREEFLVEAVRREIYFREQNGIGAGTGPARRESRDTNSRTTDRSPLNAEDIRVHAWLMERLAVLHHERHGLWPRLRRFLFGHRPERKPA